MKIHQVTKRTRKRIRKLNKKYLGLNFSGIKFHEYEPDEGDFRMAWSDATEKSVYLDPNELPSNPAYAAFVLAHEVAHVRLMHKGKSKRPKDESDASLCAQFILADKTGPKKAKSLAARWTNDWPRRFEKTQGKKGVRTKAGARKPAPALEPPTAPVQGEPMSAPAATPPTPETPAGPAPTGVMQDQMKSSLNRLNDWVVVALYKLDATEQGKGATAEKIVGILKDLPEAGDLLESHSESAISRTVSMVASTVLGDVFSWVAYDKTLPGAFWLTQEGVEKARLLSRENDA